MNIHCTPSQAKFAQEHTERLRRMSEAAARYRAKTIKPAPIAAKITPPESPKPNPAVNSRDFYEMAWDILEPWETPIETFPITQIIAIVAEHFNIQRKDMLSKSRVQAFARPRMVAYYFARHFTLLSLPAIGRFMHRDHTTMLIGIKRVKQRIAADPDFAEHIEIIRQKIEQEIRDGR